MFLLVSYKNILENGKWAFDARNPFKCLRHISSAASHAFLLLACG